MPCSRLETSLFVLLLGATAVAAEPKPGYRLFSYSFDADRVRHLAPGDAVDVIAIVERNGEAAAGAMIKMATVLDVKASESDPRATVVALQLSPAEAGYVEAARAEGRLCLARRKRGDREDAPLEFASWSKRVAALAKVRLRRRQDPVPPAPPRPGAEVRVDLSRLQDGRTALSLPLDADRVVFLSPGARVDVLATVFPDAGADAFSTTGEAGRARAVTALQNVLVLDVKPSLAVSGRAVVVLALDYAEANTAALAWETADVSLALRNPSDAATHPAEPAASLERW